MYRLTAQRDAEVLLVLLDEIPGAALLELVRRRHWGCLKHPTPRDLRRVLRLIHPDLLILQIGQGHQAEALRLLRLLQDLEERRMTITTGPADEPGFLRALRLAGADVVVPELFDAVLIETILEARRGSCRRFDPRQAPSWQEQEEGL